MASHGFSLVLLSSVNHIADHIDFFYVAKYFLTKYTFNFTFICYSVL